MTTGQLDPLEAHMTGQAWRAYDRITDIVTADRPLPGWRVDRLYDDGHIGDYFYASTRQGQCRRSRLVDAVRHDPECECGYRLVRDVYTALQFAHIQMPTDPAVAIGGIYGPGFARAGRRGSDLGFVLTRAVGTGWLAPRAWDDPPGTVRAAKTTLKEVWLPRYVGNTLAEVEALARKVRKIYGVPVHVMPGEGLYSFQGAPDTVAPKGWPECALPTPWHTSGYYGLYGAAGAMLSAVIDGERQFLLVQRAKSIVGRAWRMQLPGGALEAGETPLQAARRETMEELAIPDLGGGSVLGEVVFRHPSGWSYTTFAVDLQAVPEHKVDRLEIARATWFTEAEVLSIAQTTEMLPELAEKVPEILAAFQATSK